MTNNFNEDYKSMKLTDLTKKYGISKQQVYNILKRNNIEKKGREGNGRTKERRLLEKSKILIVFLFILFFTLSNSYAETRKVIRVVDGDTIVLDNDEKIRILGIDAYDISNKRMISAQFKRTLYYHSYIVKLGKNAKKYAEKTLIGKDIELVYENGKSKLDKYGRTLAYVFVNGKDFSEMILKENLANVYCGDKTIKNFKKYENLSKFKCK